MQLFPFRHSHQIIFRFREDLNPHLSRSWIEIFALSPSENVPSPDATLLSRYQWPEHTCSANVTAMPEYVHCPVQK